MITKVYFVRHAQSDSSVKDEHTRPLTDKGLEDTKKITNTLIDKGILAVYSSPYKRAVDTIKDFADNLGFEIRINDSFCEHKVGQWLEDYKTFSRNQWDNFEYKLSNGESFNEVQARNIAALFEVIKDNSGKNIVIGTHGLALSTIINYFNSNFGYDDFWNIIDKMPFILCFKFEDEKLIEIEEIEVI